jgi:hypothetical protein
LTSVLYDQHYTQATSDHSLFVKKTPTSFTILLVYVDDILLAGNSLTEFDHIKSILDSLFTIKDLGLLKYFLGIEVAHSKPGIHFAKESIAWIYLMTLIVWDPNLYPLHLIHQLSWIQIPVHLLRMFLLTED